MLYRTYLHVCVVIYSLHFRVAACRNNPFDLLHVVNVLGLTEIIASLRSARPEVFRVRIFWIHNAGQAQPSDPLYASVFGSRRPPFVLLETEGSSVGGVVYRHFCSTTGAAQQLKRMGRRRRALKRASFPSSPSLPVWELGKWRDCYSRVLRLRRFYPLSASSTPPLYSSIHVPSRFARQ